MTPTITQQQGGQGQGGQGQGGQGQGGQVGEGGQGQGFQISLSEQSITQLLVGQPDQERPRQTISFSISCSRTFLELRSSFSFFFVSSFFFSCSGVSPAEVFLIGTLLP